jgi:hypothetical protein
VWRNTDGTQTNYDKWRTNFGRTNFGLGGSNSPVPEPATIFLALLPAIARSMRRRRPLLTDAFGQ